MTEPLTWEAFVAPFNLTIQEELSLFHRAFGNDGHNRNRVLTPSDLRRALLLPPRA